MLLDYRSISRSLGLKERNFLDPDEMDPEDLLFLGLSIGDLHVLFVNE